MLDFSVRIRLASDHGYLCIARCGLKQLCQMREWAWDEVCTLHEVQKLHEGTLSITHYHHHVQVSRR